MKVLIAGGTGFIGSHLCRELYERGHEVTAMSRSPDGNDVPEGVETVAGDVTDFDSIEAAPEGMDAVVNLVSLSPLFRPEGGNEMHDRVHRQGTENLLRAAEAADVGRFLQMSGLSADPDGPTKFLRAKGRAEEAVRESEVPHVVFRPSVVFGDGGEFVSFTKEMKRLFAPGLPIYPLPGGGKTPFQPIWVEDLVLILADAIQEERHLGELYHVGGPDVLTLRQIANMVYESEGRSVRVVGLPMALARVGLTALGTVGFKLGPDQYHSLKMNHTTPENDVDEFGRSEGDLTTFAAYLGLASERGATRPTGTPA